MEKGQIVAATAIIASLITFFTTKEMISKSNGDDDDELYEFTSHLIIDIQNHKSSK